MYAFDFESGVPPEWGTGVSGFAWMWQSGSTGTSGTGPDAAHGGSYYMYTEAHDADADDEFDLSYDGSACAGQSAAVTFWYSMVGNSEMGTLRLKDGGGVEQWSLSGDQGMAWQEVTVSLPTASFTFEGVRGAGELSDMAVICRAAAGAAA